MSVKRCYLKANSRRGPTYRKDGSRSYRETWVVEVTSSSNDGLVAIRANGLPHLGQGYPEDSLAVCTDLDPQQSAESELVWYVEVTYAWEPAQPPGTGQQPPPGPPSEEWWRPQKFWSTVAYQHFPLQDFDGKAYKNSAGDGFEQPPERFKFHQLLTIKVRRQAFSPLQAGKYMKQPTVNDDDFTIGDCTFPPFSALLRQWDGEQNWYAGEDGKPIEYWNVTFAFEFNLDLWIPTKIVDQGRRCKILGKAGVHQTRDDNGVADGHLALLKDGYELPKTWPGPELLQFKDYAQKHFTDLKLYWGEA